MSQLHRRTAIVDITIVIGTLCTCACADDSFRKASPAECGMSAAAIELLGEHVRELVEKEAVIGAELHVIKDRKTVFHQAYGWADREERRRLQTGSIFCVRSMTKPLTGTAIQMLADDGKLSLEQRAAEILREFDRPHTREITIQHLLTHTSGLPMTAIHRPLAEYHSLSDVAADAAETGVEFEPGTSFQYSDAGSDTLGAIVAVVSGSPAEEFIANRILKPLGMEDALTDIGSKDADVRRVPSAYSGGTQAWQRHWQQSDRPIFPLFLTSQGLYCTTTDYARLLALWMDGGTRDGQRLLSQDAVNRALSPGWHIGDYPTGFGNLALTYGQQWMVYHREGSRQPVVFGHDGSDGTHAWAWPQQDLMVLFFTQSRGTLAGVELESVMHRLLIEGDIDRYRSDRLAKSAAEKSLKRYEGMYWDEDVDSDYYVVLLDRDQLVVERPGRFRAVASPQPDEGTFVVAGGAIKIAFNRETEPVAAMLMTTSRRTERHIRHEPAANLPEIEDVIAKVSRAHAIDRLMESGVIKLSGTITMGPRGRTGSIRQWFDSRRSRTEIEMGSTTMTVITNGHDAAASAAGGPLERLEGVARIQEVLAHPAIQSGGWRRGYTQLDILKQVERKREKHLLVRAIATGMPGATIVVDGETGLVVGDQRLQFLPGVGFVGLESTYSDFREVAGMTLPFHIESRYASPLLGKVVVQYDSHQVGASASDLFDLPTD